MSLFGTILDVGRKVQDLLNDVKRLDKESGEHEDELDSLNLEIGNLRDRVSRLEGALEGKVQAAISLEMANFYKDMATNPSRQLPKNGEDNQPPG
ncbi:hypothetical protein LA6_006393 (plasmid) [Marinibacterium anthonyi]|nr:hypothetical protein LA6_006393 [Marinibacterium anthonyi]